VILDTSSVGGICQHQLNGLFTIWSGCLININRENFSCLPCSGFCILTSANAGNQYLLYRMSFCCCLRFVIQAPEVELEPRHDLNEPGTACVLN